MTSWVRGLVLALVFAVLGAFSASLWLELRRETPAAERAASGVWSGRRVRVEILNGAGVDRLARRATERLRELGFDVVYYGNAPEFDRDTSVAIARLESVEPARRVADALGLRRVSHEQDRNLYLDVTVILGRDWPGWEEEAALQEPGKLEAWWRRIRSAVRRLVGV